MRLISIEEAEDLLWGETAGHILSSWPAGYRDEALFETELEGGIWPFDDYTASVVVHAIWHWEWCVGFLWCELDGRIADSTTSHWVLSGLAFEGSNLRLLQPVG